MNRTIKWCLVLGAVMLAVACSSSPAEPTRTAASRTPNIPVPAPPADAAARAAALGKFPGLKASDAIAYVQASPVTIDLVDDVHMSNDVIRTRCGSRPDPETGSQLEACVHSLTQLEDVWAISVTISPMSQHSFVDLKAAQWLLPYVASIPIDGYDKQAAVDWVNQEWPKIEASSDFSMTSREFGSAKIEIGGGQGIGLEMDISAVKK